MRFQCYLWVWRLYALVKYIQISWSISVVLDCVLDSFYISFLFLNFQSFFLVALIASSLATVDVFCVIFLSSMVLSVAWCVCVCLHHFTRFNDNCLRFSCKHFLFFTIETWKRIIQCIFVWNAIRFLVLINIVETKLTTMITIAISNVFDRNLMQYYCSFVDCLCCVYIFFHCPGGDIKKLKMQPMNRSNAKKMRRCA